MASTPQDSSDGVGGSPNDHASLVCFRKFPRREPANILAAVLNDNGVEATVFGDDAGGAMPFIGSTQGYRVMIDAGARDRASEIEDESREALAAAMATTASSPAPWTPSQRQGEEAEVADTVRYGTFWRRAAALLIDHFVFLPLGVAYDCALRTPPASTALAPVLAAGILLAWYAYRIVMHARYGQTLGKMATGVVVLDISESRRINTRQAFVRDSVPFVIQALILLDQLPRISNGTSDLFHVTAPSVDAPNLAVDAMLVWVLLNVVTLLINSRRRAIHDLMAGSVVIKEEGKRNEE